jgi:hypothetical protein
MLRVDAIRLQVGLRLRLLLTWQHVSRVPALRVEEPNVGGKRAMISGF